jgi:methylmalonyl-CoA mutase
MSEQRKPVLSEFPPVPTAAWMEVVTKDLKGADFNKRLVWQTDEGIAMKPFYRAEDLAGLEYLDAPPGAFPYVRGAHPSADWEIREAPAAEMPGMIEACAFHDAGGTAVQELGYGMAAGIEYLATAPQRGLTAEDAAGAISFCFAVGSNFFFEIAKLRAARLLWGRICESFGCSRCASKMALHVRTSRWNKTVYDPYNNVLRATTEAMAATLGGCDSLYVAPFDAVYRDPDENSKRLARNTQLILKNEAWFDRVADPAAGSYYVEALTDSLSREAWQLMQEVERSGGFAAARQSIDAAVAQSRAKKQAALAARRKTLVGTNNYPNTAERALPNAAESVLHANEPRLADAFEQIRLATERSGKTPKILLAEIGDLKMRKARSTFISNFLGCAGFDLKAESFADATQAAAAAKDAAAVVLCSSDAEYPTLAPALIDALKAAGSKTAVIIAGYPQDTLEQLKAAGVADFIHIRSNAVETLKSWQVRLGITE